MEVQNVFKTTLLRLLGSDSQGSDDPCAGYGETWGPGIGPPPAGCGGGGGGAGAQLEDVEHASITVLSPFATIWIVLFIFALIIRQRY